MLETGRTRYFFTVDYQKFFGVVKDFVEENGGEQQKGAPDQGGFRFADPAGGQRFLTISLLPKPEESELSGQITFRWRDEPTGSFVEKTNRLESRLSEEFELLGLAEARRRQQ